MDGFVNTRSAVERAGQTRTKTSAWGRGYPPYSPSLAQLAASHVLCSALGMGYLSSLSLATAHSEASLGVKQNIPGSVRTGQGWFC